ncbi:MAG TPA: D-2-hydroxyacid dehydrogenase family protein, partial [Beijerinckiaceae bacterium]|nr:D-2-hydroxyacid dehydrogenase family protein [Beijerinckiaceae bacterium]
DYQRVAATLGDWDRLGPDVAIEVFDRNLASVDEAAAALAPYEVVCLMRERMPMPRALIERLPNLKLIVVTGARTRSIDFEAAAERGIPVCHTRGGESHHATPELAWGLILSCARAIPQEHARVRAGAWQETIGTVLHGKTIGLLGLGKLGQRMVPVARAFGMEVIAWSQNLTPERAREGGAEYVDKEALFSRADVVSIHLVLGERTRGIVGGPELSRMKAGAILINTSRGPLVDQTALLEALEAGRIRAGLDVFDVEPLPENDPLRGAPNLVTTPHLGYVTEGTYQAFFEDMVEDIVAWRAGAPVRLLGPA